MESNFPDTMPIPEARARYFAVNGFAADGGYGDPFVNVRFFGVPLSFPNVEGRIRAVKLHDLHHLVTGYGTDNVGEFEISGWEIGAGCRGFAVAWMLNLAGIAAGMLAAPRRTFRAFVRGRRSRSLYGLRGVDVDAETVGGLRAHLSMPAEIPSAEVSDFASYAVAAATGWIVGLAMVPFMLMAAPVGFGIASMRRA